MALHSTLALRPKEHFFALIAYEDDYVQPLILDALRKLFPPECYTLLSPPPPPPKPPTGTKAGEGEEGEGEGDTEIRLADLLPSSGKGGSDPTTGNAGDAAPRVLQITPYEAIDWDYVATHPRTCLVNSYMLRKAVIRKHYLAATAEVWGSKRGGESALAKSFRRPEAFELDYAEFLDDALVEAFDLRASLEKNARLLGGEGEGDGEEGKEKGKEEIEWWILKPGMSDRGQGIRLFSTMEELQGIFDEWEEDQPDTDDEDEGEEDEDGDGDGDGDNKGGDYIMASHLRHFIAQPYIHPPLLLPGDNRKFHIRTYVACIGSLDVYVYDDMLALFAGRPYAAPSPPASGTRSTVTEQLEAHLTNTCLQRSVQEGTVRRFADLTNASLGLPEATRASVVERVRAVAGDVFEAAAREMRMHFAPLPNAFEVYGLDFLVDAAGHPWLLEVNAFPDFRQTGPELTGLVAGLWEAVLRRAVAPFFFGHAGAGASGASGALIGEEGRDGDGDARDEYDDGLVLVRRIDLGAR